MGRTAREEGGRGRQELPSLEFTLLFTNVIVAVIEQAEGTSVDDAYDEWCDSIAGVKVYDKPNENILYKRWGYAEWGVPNRHSFWLKAMYVDRDGCQGWEEIHKHNCKAAMRVGMETCANGSPRTLGMSIPGKGCVDYSIHISDGVHEGSPPWNDHVVGYPPPESALSPDYNYSNLTCGTDYVSGVKPGARVNRKDIDAVVNQWCSGDGGWMEKTKHEKIGPFLFIARVAGGKKYKDPKWCE